MTRYSKNCFLAFVIFCWFSFTLGNIHRAVPGTPVFSKLLKVKNNEQNDDILLDEDEDDGFFDRIYSKASTAWLYSIPASLIVGVIGTFPLLIFRKSGKSLKGSVSEAHLNILLSFAVGGLLGDVFLHLLPEAWMYIENSKNDHSGSLGIGLWIIFGLLSFLTFEKIFDFESKENPLEKSDEKVDLEDDYKNLQVATKSHENGYHNGEIKNRKKKSLSDSHLKNGVHLANGSTTMLNNDMEGTEKDMKNDDERKPIKVSGYLNLFANVIDNFTHGLAIAGGFIVSVPVGTCTFGAILLHEIPHEIGDFAVLLDAGFDREEAAKAQVITASGALFGCLFGLLAEGAGDTSAWVLPFTSGGFLYIALVTIVPKLLKEEDFWESIKQLIALMLGIGAMGLVTFLTHN